MTARPMGDRVAQAAELRDWYVRLRRMLLLAVQGRGINPAKAGELDRLMLELLDRREV
jgi:hypothetical protein